MITVSGMDDEMHPPH